MVLNLFNNYLFKRFKGGNIMSTNELIMAVAVILFLSPFVYAIFAISKFSKDLKLNKKHP